MFEVFQRTFARDLELSVKSSGAAPPSSVLGWTAVIDGFGGSSFDRGLYRVMRATDIDEWSARVALAFPHFGSRVVCFAFDWLGRVFAVDLDRNEGGQPGVVMFEPGTGEAL